MLAPWKKSNDKPKQHIKKQRHYFADKDPSSQSYGFSSTHVGMWELDNRKGWAPKNWFLRTVVLEKTLESPLDCKEFKPVNPKGNQHWIFIGRADAEVEAPILWPPDAKSWLTRKDPDAGEDWRQEEKRAAEDEMVGWYQRLNGHEFAQTPGDGKAQGSLLCCNPWGRKESDMTERLNNNKLKKKRATKNCHNSSPHKIHNEQLNHVATRVLISPLLPSRSPKWLTWIFDFWIFYLSLKFIDCTCRYMLELFVD